MEPARERGQVLPLVAVLIVLGGLACVVAGKLGGAAAARAQAATAADAAALAGAAAGPEAAHEAARANGGRLTRYERQGADTRVTVSLGGATARARARRLGGGPGDAAPHGPAPALRAALARAAQLLGRPVPLDRGPYAPPSGDARADAARHRRGLAVHVPATFAEVLAPVAGAAGLCRPDPGGHPVHFEVCGYRLP